jgi:hypothetical protein
MKAFFETGSTLRPGSEWLKTGTDGDLAQLLSEFRGVVIRLGPEKTKGRLRPGSVRDVAARFLRFLRLLEGHGLGG